MCLYVSLCVEVLITFDVYAILIACINACNPILPRLIDEFGLKTIKQNENGKKVSESSPMVPAQPFSIHQWTPMCCTIV